MSSTSRTIAGVPFLCHLIFFASFLVASAATPSASAAYGLSGANVPLPSGSP